MGLCYSCYDDKSCCHRYEPKPIILSPSVPYSTYQPYSPHPSYSSYQQYINSIYPQYKPPPPYNPHSDYVPANTQ